MNSFYNGSVIYINQSRIHPKIFNNYPISWAYVDDCLVLIYSDNKLHYVNNNAIENEVNNQIIKNYVHLYDSDSWITEENTGYRFTKVGKDYEISRSNFYLKLCK